MRKLIGNLVSLHVSKCTARQPLAIKNVGQRQRIHKSCKHPDVVCRDTANAAASQLRPTSIVTTTNHNDYLRIFYFFDFIGNPCGTFCIESTIIFTL